MPASDPIDQRLVDMIVAAHKAGALEITETVHLGARLRFMYLQTKMELHLGVDNWETVKAALAQVKGGN